MKRIVCAILLSCSCAYGSGDEGFAFRMMLAKENINFLRALGIGYCLGYDVEKLYDELQKWFDVNEADRNNIINEIRTLVDAEKSKLTKPARKYDETAMLFNNCFFIDSMGYREAIQHLAEKYCVKNCDAIKHLRDWCRY